jgi:hypothetical protein
MKKREAREGSGDILTGAWKASLWTVGEQEAGTARTYDSHPFSVVIK